MNIRKVAPLLVTILILGLLGTFVLRVVFLYQKISRGELDSVSSLTFTNALSISPRLEQAVKQTDPSLIQDVDSLDDPSLGSTDAKLTIVEFADFGCPYSYDASSAIRALSLTYGDRIRFVYRDFPLTDLHPDAEMAAEAGECVREQDANKFWAYHDLLFQNQTDLSRTALRGYAQSVGVNISKFDQCLASGRYRQEVLNDLQDGIDAGVVGTPTFFFNGQRVAGAIPLETLRVIVDAYLK